MFKKSKNFKKSYVNHKKILNIDQKNYSIKKNLTDSIQPHCTSLQHIHKKLLSHPEHKKSDVHQH